MENELCDKCAFYNKEKNYCENINSKIGSLLVYFDIKKCKFYEEGEWENS